jgi:hypothetical protein
MLPRTMKTKCFDQQFLLDDLKEALDLLATEWEQPKAYHDLWVRELTTT